MTLPRPVRFLGIAVGVAGLVLWATRPGTGRVLAAVLAAVLGGSAYAATTTYGRWSAVLPLFAGAYLAGYLVAWLVVTGLPVVLAGAPPGAPLERPFVTVVPGLIVGFPAFAGLFLTGLVSELA